MNTSILEDLGLTNAEIKVYITLLELGNSTAGPILEKSGSVQEAPVHLSTIKLLSEVVVSVQERSMVVESTAEPVRSIGEV